MTSSKDATSQSRKDEPAETVAVNAAFPNIAGEWIIDIHWQRGGDQGSVEATALIQHGNVGLSMQVHSSGSESHTIFAHAGLEGSGIPVIYYLYEVEPKALGSDAGSAYKGAAILRFNANRQELSGNYWTSQLSKGHFRLSRKTNSAIDRAGNENVDVVLITAISEEFDAAKTAFSATQENQNGVREWTSGQASANSFLHGVFYQDDSPLFRMAVARPTRMGANRTSPLAATLVNALKPACLVMCGVCAGNPNDLALGDIVVSELVYQYDEGRRKLDGDEGDHRQSPISREWLEAAQRLRPESLPSFGRPSLSQSRFWLLERLYRGDNPLKHSARPRYFERENWKAVLSSLEADGLVKTSGASLALTDAGRAEVDRSLIYDIDPPLTLPFAIKVGPIASGNVVVKDGKAWKKLTKMGVRSILAVDMEAAAIGEVARQCDVAQWIIIKAVMDHADPNKDDRFKQFAARASAEALRAFLVDRFRERTIKSLRPNDSISTTTRTLANLDNDGRFKDQFWTDLKIAVGNEAPRFAQILDRALSVATDAYGIVEGAQHVADKARVALGDAIVKAYKRSIGKSPKVLRTSLAKDARPLIAKIWSSHDEYLGEAIGDEPDGLGVIRVYMISSEITPSSQACYAGRFEQGRYGPLGVFSFFDKGEFAGEWTSGHPCFGYRTYLGDFGKLNCDFYLGHMKGDANRFQPRWYPHGEGIAIDASSRSVICGVFLDGELHNTSAKFSF